MGVYVSDCRGLGLGLTLTRRAAKVRFSESVASSSDRGPGILASTDRAACNNNWNR